MFVFVSGGQEVGCGAAVLSPHPSPLLSVRVCVSCSSSMARKRGGGVGNAESGTQGGFGKGGWWLEERRRNEL